MPTGFVKITARIYHADLAGQQVIVILADKIIDSMEAIDVILNEVDKLQPNEKLQLLHQLVDRMLAVSTPELTSPIDFDKYVGIGKNIWGTDAQTYIDERRNENRF